nr:immunoglobulin heavy chain junction region [Macaca mulatta]
CAVYHFGSGLDVW